MVIRKRYRYGSYRAFDSKQVDSGKIICKETIQIQKDDTILDINERLYDKQLDVLIKSLEALAQKDDQDHEIIDLTYPNYGKMEIEEEIQAIAKLNQYILKRTSS
jgi:methionyl-tRNA formyltransferase